MAVTEALAHGIPVLATRVGGLPGGAWAGHPAGGDPASSYRPTTPARSPGRWSSGSATPGCGRTCAPRPQGRRASLPTWSATSAEVARVLAAVAA